MTVGWEGYGNRYATLLGEAELEAIAKVLREG
mgnify:CR=1 FL=1